MQVCRQAVCWRELGETCRREMKFPAFCSSGAVYESCLDARFWKFMSVDIRGFREVTGLC